MNRRSFLGMAAAAPLLPVVAVGVGESVTAPSAVDARTSESTSQLEYLLRARDDRLRAAIIEGIRRGKYRP